MPALAQTPPYWSGCEAGVFAALSEVAAIELLCPCPNVETEFGNIDGNEQ